MTFIEALIIVGVLYIVISNALAFYKGYTKFKGVVSEEIRKRKLEENPIIYIEHVQHNGTEILMVYNAANKKFVCQATNPDDLANEVFRVFSNKRAISVIYSDNTLKHIQLNK